MKKKNEKNIEKQTVNFFLQSELSILIRLIRAI